MNNKGFTLIELLATVVLLSLVMGIGAYGVSNTIANSKKRTEKIFVDKLDSAIEEYIDLYGIELSESSTEMAIKKCYKEDCYNSSTNSYVSGKYYDATIKELTSINILDLVTKNLLDGEKLINPANKKKCFNSSKNPVIRIFKDSEYVYYYYVDLSSNNCELSNEFTVINTLPDNIRIAVGIS